jgi:hypothetical protein
MRTPHYFNNPDIYAIISSFSKGGHKALKTKKNTLFDILLILFASLCIVGMLLTSGALGHREPRPAVVVEGTPGSISTMVRRGNIYLPIRIAAETIGYSVNWDAQYGTTFRDGNYYIAIPQRSTEYYRNGTTHELSELPLTQGGQAYMLLTDFAEMFDLDYVFDGAAVKLSKR